MESLRVIYNGIACTITLCTHTTLIVACECLSLFLWPFSKKLYYGYLSHIMRQWSQNLFQVMRRFNSGDMIITFDQTFTDGDEDPDKLETFLTRNKSGQVVGISFPERLIMIANHQIYADWIYIWFIAYLSKAHGALKIMLKDSLSKGMRFFEFIFLKRRLEQDKDNIIRNLTSAKKGGRPMWLVLFPEGTVISDNTRLKSKTFAQKLNMEDFKFTLLPRTTGLLLAKETLGDSVEWIYDLTVAYPGIEPGQNPEDVMTMKRMFCEGRGPSEIHVFVERFRLDSLPTDTEAFTAWLLERWTLKDKRLIYFNEHGKLPKESDLGTGEDERIFNGRTVKIPIQLQHPIRECYSYLAYLLFYIPIVYAILLVLRQSYTALVA